LSSAAIAASCARLLAIAAIEQGQLDILERGGAREQVEALEDEAEIFAAQQRALVAVERLDMDALEQEGARSARRGSPGCSSSSTCPSPTGPSPRRNRPPDIEIDALQRLERGRALAIALVTPRRDERVGHYLAAAAVS
jgi:hypothetical protein